MGIHSCIILLFARETTPLCPPPQPFQFPFLKLQTEKGLHPIGRLSRFIRLLVLCCGLAGDKYPSAYHLGEGALEECQRTIVGGEVLAEAS